MSLGKRQRSAVRTGTSASRSKAWSTAASAERDDIDSVTVLRFHHGEATTEYRRESPKVEVYYMRAQYRGRMLTRSVLDLRKARKLIAELKPDVVHGQEIGVISAYNGHNVDVGRIVADSTWHHWFDINLTGIAAPPSPYAGFDDTLAGRNALRQIDAYFLNVGVWLAPPSCQASAAASGSP